MKSICFFAVMTFPLLGIAGTKKLSCENKNIKIEIRQARTGSLKYQYEDFKRKAFAIFEKSSYTFNGSSDGDFISLEMYPQAPVSYTAVIEDYEEMLNAKVGTRGIPLLIMFEDQNGYEKHINTSCEVIAL